MKESLNQLQIDRGMIDQDGKPMMTIKSQLSCVLMKEKEKRQYLCSPGKIVVGEFAF